MVQFKAGNYKKITLAEMVKYIEENDPESKSWFKEVAYQNKNGEAVESYNHLNAVKEFCKKYAPELLPEKKGNKKKASEIFANW